MRMVELLGLSLGLAVKRADKLAPKTDSSNRKHILANKIEEMELHYVGKAIRAISMATATPPPRRWGLIALLSGQEIWARLCQEE